MDVDSLVKKKKNKILFNTDILNLYLENKDDVILDKIVDQFGTEDFNVALNIKKAAICYFMIKKYTQDNCISIESEQEIIF